MDGNITFLSLCTYIITDEEEPSDELKEIIDELSSIERPEHLGNQKIDVDLDDLQSTNLMFSDGELSTPSPTEYNALNIAVDDEYDVHIHADFFPDDLEEMLNALSRYLLGFDGRILNYLNVYYMSESHVDDLNVELDVSEDYTVSGLEVRSGDDDIWIGFRHDQSDDVMRVTYRYKGEFGEVSEPDDLIEFVETKTDKALESIGEFNNECS